MTSEAISALIVHSAAELRRLHVDLHAKAVLRKDGPEAVAAWRQAAATFHARYDLLAFPGGYDGAFTRIQAGDEVSVEAMICFLELRPYFFRSGYMFKDLLRKARKAPLSDSQRHRFAAIELAVRQWRERKLEARRNTI